MARDVHIDTLVFRKRQFEKSELELNQKRLERIWNRMKGIYPSPDCD